VALAPAQTSSPIADAANPSSDRDYRVPVGEALRLWSDLKLHGKDGRFLYFPDENHWILSPGNARIWYETVFAFLAEHVLGQGWIRPALL